MSEPQGVAVVHKYPGDTIELMLWSSGDAPLRWKITDRNALNLLADLAAALRSNGK
jgi:hypothetical protein